MMKKPQGFPWESLGRKMAEVLKALGDLNRMKIIKILASNPDESICVSELAEMLSVTQSAASQHIKVLKSVGILVPRRIENRTYYTIDAGALKSYQNQINDMFRMAFVRCTYDGDCSTCPDRGHCN
jgi:ArsR family transcriptional regulator, arsenate/arsenite/antimonite-responsive transcriptional repressor